MVAGVAAISAPAAIALFPEPSRHKPQSKQKSLRPNIKLLS
jgi:hypothetical protein